MDIHKYRLIVKAQEQYRDIYPCCPDKRMDECFTQEGGMHIFWFATRDNSTHIVMTSSRGECIELKLKPKKIM